MAPTHDGAHATCKNNVPSNRDGFMHTLDEDLVTIVSSHHIDIVNPDKQSFGQNAFSTLDKSSQTQ